jgi:hypothetical protein
MVMMMMMMKMGIVRALVPTLQAPCINVDKQEIPLDWT